MKIKNMNKKFAIEEKNNEGSLQTCATI